MFLFVPPANLLAPRAIFPAASPAPPILHRSPHQCVFPPPFTPMLSCFHPTAVARSQTPCSSRLVRMTFARASSVTAHCSIVAHCNRLTALLPSLITCQGACAKQLWQSVVFASYIARRALVLRLSLVVLSSSLFARRSPLGKKCKLKFWSSVLLLASCPAGKGNDSLRSLVYGQDPSIQRANDKRRP